MSASAHWRLAAFGIDWCVLSIYGGLWFGGAYLVYGLDGLEASARTYDAWRGQAIGFVTLTLPFTLYFAFCESSRWQATLGKRALGLSVVAANGNPLTFGRALARAAIKFLPWEVAHVFTNHLFEHGMRTPEDPEPTWFWALFAVSMGGALIYTVSLFLGDGRTPYDRVAGTRVIAAATT